MPDSKRPADTKLPDNTKLNAHQFPGQLPVALPVDGCNVHQLRSAQQVLLAQQLGMLRSGKGVPRGGPRFLIG
jgi:hypothetical protein